MIFSDFDLENFWKLLECAAKEYTGEPLTLELVAAVEATLGYKLPTAYVASPRSQNGGTPAGTNCRTREATSWTEDHVAIFGIDKLKPSSL